MTEDVINFTVLILYHQHHKRIYLEFHLDRI